jgi:hypothetical protein
MADDLRALLLYIVDNTLKETDSEVAQINATAVQDVPREVQERDDDQRRDAERLSPAFATGLRMATAGPVVVEDTDSEGNAIAEAFARYLVTPGLATSESEAIAGGHFRYRFDVDWQRLREIAKQANVDLDGALRSSR